jgi:hypothetical protein
MLLAMAGGSPSLYAAVGDVTVTDVTTRAFSVVWASDEPVDTYEVRVFAGQAGGADLAPGLTIEAIAGDDAKARGVIKIDVSGLDAEQTYYVQTVTNSTGGQFLSPASAPFLPVTTAVQTTKVGAGDAPIVNDLLLQDVLAPDQVSPASGALLLIKIPTYSAYPLSAFSGEGIALPAAIVDLNNLFDDAGGVSAELAGGEVAELVEFRGAVEVVSGCTLNNHKLELVRKVPLHEETPPITELESPASCFAPQGVPADFTCDGKVGPGDFNKFLRQFALQVPDCSFGPDYDLAVNNIIDPGDFNKFLSVFGAEE